MIVLERGAMPFPCPKTYSHLFTWGWEPQESSLQESTALGTLVKPHGQPWAVLFGKRPWHDPPDLKLLPYHLASEIFYLPFQGWDNGHWFDGPLLHASRDHGVLNLVPLGGPARLYIEHKSLEKVSAPEQCDITGWLDDEDGAGCKLSLSWALRQKFGELQALLLEPRHFDLNEALLLVLFRVAFPSKPMRLRTLPEGEAELWRRLCQNLAISFGRTPFPADTKSLDIPLSELRTLIPDSHLVLTAQRFNLKSAVIPPKLLTRTS